MSAGTLLSDLDQNAGGGGGGDSDLVQQILQDMNHPTQASGGRPAPPPMPQQQPVYQQQMAGTTAPITMDSRIPTAHIIGNEHPTPAQFASAINGMPMMSPQPIGMMPGVATQQYTAPSKNLYGRILDEVKIPFVVALLFFVFSLPPVRVLCAHYLPSLIKQTGDFTTVGLLGVSAVVGTFFWILHRVIAPLLSF